MIVAEKKWTQRRPCCSRAISARVQPVFLQHVEALDARFLHLSEVEQFSTRVPCGITDSA
eukprot:1581660-Prymnesium_polylepis.1